MALLRFSSMVVLLELQIPHVGAAIKTLGLCFRNNLFNSAWWCGNFKHHPVLWPMGGPTFRPCCSHVFVSGPPPYHHSHTSHCSDSSIVGNGVFGGSPLYFLWYVLLAAISLSCRDVTLTFCSTCVAALNICCKVTLLWFQVLLWSGRFGFKRLYSRPLDGSSWVAGPMPWAADISGSVV